MTASVTILGSGSSGGVPRPALGWGACDPRNPRNRRRRTSLLVERRNGAGVTRVLVDTPPDLREQLLDQLAVPAGQRDFAALTQEHALKSGTPLPAPQGVFPRYVEPATEAVTRPP